MAPPESALRAGPMMSVPRDTLRSLSISPRKPETFRLEDRSVPSVISPASKVKQKPIASEMSKSTQKKIKPPFEEPTQETFKELSGLLQTFIDRRKPLLQRVTISPPTTPTPTRIWAHEQKAEDTTPSTSSVGQWETMNPEEETEDVEEIEPPETEDEPDWESRMRELSGQLSAILMQIKKAKESRQLKYGSALEKPRPKVTILRNGSANQTNDGRYNFIATITLVQDNGKNILVDTGLGTDINGRTQLLSALEQQNIAAPGINVVVTTHGHPDHAGGVHDFPDAIHYQGWYIHHRTMFNLSSLFESDRHTLTDNVYLMKSTGHSSDDVAVVVMDEQTMGKVIIAGDTFMRREDLDYPMMWQPLSANETEQAKSRRNVICEAGWIIPGHGAPFQVTRQMRVQFHC
ncbi:hypothetical protein Y032_0021g266 [Ancylostoma ceylanicum]|uniref:Metallo-beta-lactamase domain-containing protein 1 n=2 Tax=Ancylostoma ceylanicum TaxID=53326 RepID=A0A016V001_9BILA|nr:hypothetical protein Y032_0021g266 [Ancylostoma ceylanicum]